MTFFIGPTAGATGEAGQKFVGHLMNNLKFSNRMAAASGLTLLAGFILYFRGGAALMESRFGIGLGIGALFALIGFVSGMFIGRTIKAMAEPWRANAGQTHSKPTHRNAGFTEAASDRFHDFYRSRNPGNGFYGNCPLSVTSYETRCRSGLVSYAFYSTQPQQKALNKNCIYL